MIADALHCHQSTFDQFGNFALRSARSCAGGGDQFADGERGLWATEEHAENALLRTREKRVGKTYVSFGHARHGGRLDLYYTHSGHVNTHFGHSASRRRQFSLPAERSVLSACPANMPIKVDFLKMGLGESALISDR
ncbi:MAG: hypothetical protein ABI451_03240 [Dokdonella sp.]